MDKEISWSTNHLAQDIFEDLGLTAWSKKYWSHQLKNSGTIRLRQRGMLDWIPLNSLALKKGQLGSTKSLSLAQTSALNRTGVMPLDPIVWWNLQNTNHKSWRFLLAHIRCTSLGFTYSSWFPRNGLGRSRTRFLTWFYKKIKKNTSL